MLYQIIINNLYILKPLLLMLAYSISTRVVLDLIGQNWITSLAHTATITLLPIITYVITTVIAGNIALSLGMVGALSIVRFRNPVRSPLELSIYFSSITIGIAATIDVKWVILLWFSILFVLIFLKIANYLFKKLMKKTLYNTTFSEGNHLSTLSIELKSPSEYLHNNPFLISKLKTEESISKYIFASEDFNDLLNLLDVIRKNNNNSEINKYELTK